MEILCFMVNRLNGIFLGMEAEFLLNPQAHYDLAITREALAENLAAIKPLEAAAQLGAKGKI